MIKAVIFDMDGVLIDSQPLHFKADMTVLKRCGQAVGLSVVERYAGVSNPNRWAMYKDDFQLSQTVEELIEIHVSVIDELLEQEELFPIDGVITLLEEIIRRGLKTAVASSSSYDFIYKVLNKIDLTKYFGHVVSGEDLKNGKPAPDIFLHTAEILGASPDECVVIEDSKNGVLAAYASGMRCIGYRNESSGDQDLSKATVIISDFAQANDEFEKYFM